MRASLWPTALPGSGRPFGRGTQFGLPLCDSGPELGYFISQKIGCERCPLLLPLGSRHRRQSSSLRRPRGALRVSSRICCRLLFEPRHFVPWSGIFNRQYARFAIQPHPDLRAVARRDRVVIDGRAHLRERLGHLSLRRRRVERNADLPHAPPLASGRKCHSNTDCSTTLRNSCGPLNTRNPPTSPDGSSVTSTISGSLDALFPHGSGILHDDVRCNTAAPAKSTLTPGPSNTSPRTLVTRKPCSSCDCPRAQCTLTAKQASPRQSASMPGNQERGHTPAFSRR